MNDDSLASDLYKHLLWWTDNSNPPHHWVMDAGWLNICRQMASAMSPYWAATLPETPDLLLGLPVEIRDHDDRPDWQWRVPHLEAK